ncbi:PIG-L family deacetylase [Pedobacter sp. SYSU D00535]|uniref:PIG-L family deacetylase n=1 Tax=Pedobacter sp. SYSU D00535 TaxID=2810308 RepID=UPI001A965EE4|nr:PIG-L family deacetylase [Pedobacter sp. SYSU D00535]
MIREIRFSALLLLLGFSLSAQTSQPNSSEIKLELEKLAVAGNVLYIAAHPDDENTRLLTYLAKERKLRTGYLSLTRGDGGQNLIGNEQAELLGVIRTQELLAARRVDGAEQFFTRANDFGFSKTSDETFRIWDKQKILSDVVWVIRQFKPDVIITRFPGDARAGHGHHAASSLLAQEAFKAAADPLSFPEQLKYVKPWQAKRIVWNTFNFGGNNTTAEDQLKINVGLYNPLIGKSYGEIAAESRTKHKSQGFGSALQRGEAYEYFYHLAGEPTKTDLFDGVDISWKRVRGAERIYALIQKLNNEFDYKDPSKSVSDLLKLRQLISASPEARFKQRAVDELILACAGVWLEASAVESSYSASDSIPVRLQVIARVPDDFPYRVSFSEELSRSGDIPLRPNELKTVSVKVFKKDVQYSHPYWLRQDHPIGIYQVANQQEIGLPEAQPAYQAAFALRVGKETLHVLRPVIYKYVDQVRGEVYKPLVIAPDVTATLPEKAYLFQNGKAKAIKVELKSFRDTVSGIVKPVLPHGWKAIPRQHEFKFARKGDTRFYEFQIVPSKNTNGKIELKVITSEGTTFDRSLKVVHYEHIPEQVLFPPAEARAENIDVALSGKRLGYLAGAGDLVGESLKQIGYEVVTLQAEQIPNIDLSTFDAIVTGVRFYNVSEQAKVVQAKLMDYVKDGGILLVQYNVSNPLMVSQLGPYPFSLSRSRVTEEDAPVVLNDSNTRFFTYPNRITEDDFKGWVQERGLYFASDIDQRYYTPLVMADSGEQANRGALLIADYGKGRFIYSSLSFFRQLPAGVPGAYRIFTNLISKEKGERK